MEIFKSKTKLDSPLVEGEAGQILSKDLEGKNVWKTLEGFSVVDNLTSDDAYSGLSAKQGKILDEKITGVNNNVGTLEGEVNTLETNFNSLVDNVGGLQTSVSNLNNEVDELHNSSEYEITVTTPNDRTSENVYSLIKYGHIVILNIAKFWLESLTANSLVSIATIPDELKPSMDTTGTCTSYSDTGTCIGHGWIRVTTDGKIQYKQTGSGTTSPSVAGTIIWVIGDGNE